MQHDTESDLGAFIDMARHGLRAASETSEQAVSCLDDSQGFG